ncbi:hypothetical protein HIM_03385 [Hirsutella minnesotensis 3608]|uniref:Uncharacterized protein n=1 Tax=Hirsutella minnesotensis 3608 TaxID=1043627 RepID=A0A0F8A6H0_9HYPO|nr:hypothetical protein HIM_03385 [Hirsutella minnesotensis 3608]
MAQKPSTPVKVPSSAANHTPATLDPDLRSQINTVLLRDGHITKIHEALLHTLNSESSNWPTTIQNHALSLMRSGEATTYPALLRRVIEDVRAASASSATSKNGGSKATNGDTKKINGASESPGLALPQSVTDEALRVTKESLDAVCEIAESES